MHEYIISLALSYFKVNETAYCIDELMNFLGLTQVQMSQILKILMENNYVEYINYELKITQKGLLHLVAENQMNLELENSEYICKYVNVSKAIPLDEPYVPSNFMKKI